jgi:uncharacterized protein
MAIVNHAKREINAKIVYYGPEGAGKATSLRYVYDRIKPSLRGDLKSLPASGSSLLFFDFSPFEQPVFAGYHLRLHVYTLQGRVANPAAWKMTLKGSDGLVVVADATPVEIPTLRQSLVQLREFLGTYGVGLDDMPVVLQLNKADIAGPVAPSEVARGLGMEGPYTCLTTALRGEGVLEALTVVSRLIMDRIRERDDLPQAAEITGGDAVAASQPVQAAVAPEAEDSALTGSECGRYETAVEINLAGKDRLQVVVAERGVWVEGSTVRIPLDISQAGEVQRLVVTVMVTPA